MVPHQSVSSLTLLVSCLQVSQLVQYFFQGSFGFVLIFSFFELAPLRIFGVAFGDLFLNVCTCFSSTWIETPVAFHFPQVISNGFEVQ